MTSAHYSSAAEALRVLRANPKHGKSADLDTLEQCLRMQPSLRVWAEIQEVVAKFPEAAHGALTCWLDEALGGWPDGFRLMSDAWWQSYLAGESPLARLARMHRLAAVSNWDHGEYLGEGGETFAVWPHERKDLYLAATVLEPHRSSGELHLLGARGEEGWTLSEDDYGQGCAAAFSDDGKTLITVFGGSDGLRISAWSTLKAKRSWSKSFGDEDGCFEEQLASVALHPTLSFVAVSHPGLGEIIVLSKRGAVKYRLKSEDPVSSLCFSSDGGALFIATETGALLGWEYAKKGGVPEVLSRGETIFAAESHGTTGVRVLLRNGARVFTREGEGWVEQATERESWSPHPGGLLDGAIHPTLGPVFLVSADGGLSAYQPRSGRLHPIVQGETLWWAPLADNQEWVLISNIPTQEDSDEWTGAIFLWNPSGQWVLPARKVAPSNPLDVQLSKYQSLSAMIAEQAAPEVVAHALSSGRYDPNTPAYAGCGFERPLLIAAANCADTYRATARSFVLLPLLLERGADPALLEEGKNALHALFSGHYGNATLESRPELEEMAERLVQAGCDPWATYEDDYSFNPPFHTAPARKMAALGFVRAIGELEEHRAGLLTEAAYAGQWGVIELVLARGLDLDARDEDGQAALHWAAAHEDPTRVQTLLELGARVDVTVESDAEGMLGFTALQLAIVRGHPRVAQALIEHGANLEHTSAHGWSAADLAAEWGRLEILQTLARAGAELSPTIEQTILAETRAPQYPKKGTEDLIQERQRASTWVERYREWQRKGEGGAAGQERLFEAAARGGWEAFVEDYADGQRQFQTVDLRGARLRGKSFDHLTLGEAMAEGLDCDDTTWTDCSVHLSGKAKFTRTLFERCELEEWRIGAGELSHTRFVGCHFHKPSAGFATLYSHDTSFEGCRFSDARWRSVEHGRRFVDCRFDRLVVEGAVHSEFERCTFSESRFEAGSHLPHGFDHCTLIGTKFESPLLLIMSFQGCDLRDVDFSHVTFRDGNFRNARFDADCTFQGCAFERVDLSGADLSQCNLEGVRYDSRCQFPADFDPRKRGMTPS